MAFLFFVFLNAPLALAQEVVIEATQINEDKIEPSRSATVLQLDRNQQSQAVADVLRSVPGVEVVRQGGVGQTTLVFIRGARSEDTLVLIDGAEANDAMSPSCGFDFSTMSAENIERVEVYRGPQSVRFGAGALGGVINIVTKEGKRKLTSSYLGEVGSFSTNKESIASSDQSGILSYSVSGNYFSTKGFSAASEQSGNSEPDGAKLGSVSLKLGLEPTQTTKLETTLRYTDAEVEIDSHGGSGGDDPKNKTNAKQFVSGVKASDRFFKDQLKASIGIYFSEVDRKSHNEPNFGSTTDSADHFLSENRKAQTDVEWFLGEYHNLRFDFDYRDESGIAASTFNGTPENIPRKNQSVTGESMTYLFESSTWFFDLGSRADQSSKVGGISSYRSSFGRQFHSTGSKAFLSYGTGYKLPSLYQLYSTYGDENLKQENSTTLEATVEQKIANKYAVTLTAFENKFRDMIDYNMTTSRYFNLSRARSRGFELQGSTDLTAMLHFDASYTYLDTEDESSGLQLLRRPRNVWTLSYRFEKGNYDLSAQYSYRGEREDVDPNNFQRIKMRAYSLVSISGAYRFRKWLKTFARVENVFDEKYEEVAGYGTPSRSIYVGLSGDF